MIFYPEYDPATGYEQKLPKVEFEDRNEDYEGFIDHDYIQNEQFYKDHGPGGKYDSCSEKGSYNSSFEEEEPSYKSSTPEIENIKKWDSENECWQEYHIPIKKDTNFKNMSCKDLEKMEK